MACNNETSCISNCFSEISEVYNTSRQPYEVWYGEFSSQSYAKNIIMNFLWIWKELITAVTREFIWDTFKYMQYSNYWEAESCSAAPEMSYHLWNQKLLYQFNNSTPLNLNLSQFNCPIHSHHIPKSFNLILTPCLCVRHPSILLPSRFLIISIHFLSA